MKHSPEFLKLVEDSRTRVHEVTIDDVLGKQRRQEPFEFVDVREDSEWAAGHAAGARHLGRGVIERDIETAIPDRGREIILYCGGGFRSALSADNLQKMGYRRVFSMAGGMRAWRERGLPEEKP